MKRRAALELLFPKLRGTQWSIISRRNKRYNCFAWAAGENDRKWDFGKKDYWPKGVKKGYGIAYLVAAYVAEGFSVCPKAECAAYDPSCETIVLYELHTNGSHAARLLPNGAWTSKIGALEDIQHEAPEHLSGTVYGDPLVYMKRNKFPAPKAVDPQIE